MSNNTMTTGTQGQQLVNTTVKILAIFTWILAGMSIYSSITFWGVPMQGDEAKQATYWLGYSTLMLIATFAVGIFGGYLWMEATWVDTTEVVDTTVPVGAVTAEWNSTHGGVTTTCTTCQCEFTTPYVVSQPLCDDCWYAKQVALCEAEDALLAEVARQEDFEYVDCGYCSTPTANNSGVCSRCMDNPQWIYQQQN